MYSSPRPQCAINAARLLWVPLGIVYRTDALIDKGVRIVDTFPADTHPPITYPIALTVGAKSVAAQFADYLGKPAVGAVFVRYGFTVLH